jgi:TolB protein
MTADLQDLFDRAGKNPPTHAFDADAVLLRARRAHNRRIAGVVAAAVAVTVALVAGLAGQRLLSADPVPAAPHPTVAPHPIALVPGSLGRLAYGFNGDIYVADADGSNRVRVADGAPGEQGFCIGYWGEGPLWSPDGRYLAYRGDGGESDGPGTCDRTVNISDPEGHHVASFPGDGWAIAWSPDSTRVAVWDNFYAHPTLGIYGLDGVRQAQIILPPDFELPGDVDPVWSPDGESILVRNGIEIPVDGSTPRQLPANDPRSQWNATYSPDGTDVAYVSENGLTVAAADGSQARLLVPGGLGDFQVGPFTGPVWSPTGDRIAFISQPGDGPTVLRVVDVAGGTVVSLADMSGPNTIGYLTFSPEGDQILFTRYAKAGNSLWSVHADGSHLRRVVAGTGWGDWQKLIPTR